ncbi:hypothetical protein [Alcanivorax quisquiliarum]|uniref:Nucleotidyltransferase substrate binding protein, HI0074 family n=1 Tax=Alcanivorax quisquiliarum TaxID=2933565 RepID=A0ABT0EAY1_9GAMM|nr:hypothetical protein [Alcanivorax quisquiliarum]MCK0538782.1 hypothetical protein [Alcanivorax quisquiliarum]
MSSNLENLVRTGQLKLEPAAEQEVRGLLESGQRRLRDADNKELALESRFDLAYNAAHALSLAALRRSGFRSENRYLVFQTLSHTTDLSAAQWRVLNDAHRRRNLAEYEGHLEIDEGLVAAIIRVAHQIQAHLAAFLE